MNLARDNLDREFDIVYEFLKYQLPRIFVDECGIGYFDVCSGVDEPVASFLMHYDQYSDSVPLSIQSELTRLSLPWMVIGSFSIREPFDENGQIVQSPFFTVSKLSIAGETNIKSLLLEWGDQLVSARELAT